jgi:DHA2 family multidrug resistance protein
MIWTRSTSVRDAFAAEVLEGVSVAQLCVMAAALVSLYVDQSFSGAYQAIQTYAGGTLGASADELPWASIGYNACYYTLILLTPWLMARLGRRALFSGGHVIFGMISLYLATTGSLHGFMIGRCLQGLAQGTFFVCSVITVLTLFPMKLRGYAFSIFSVTSLSGAASGAFVGGWFIDHAYWRGAFVLYAVLAVSAGLVISVLLDAEGPHPMPAFDAPGVALAFVAFFAFQYVAAFGERRDWLSGTDIDAFAVVCVACFAGFVWREIALGERAFIPLRLFEIRNLAVASVLGFGLGVPLFGANLFLQYAQGALGFPPSTAGALLTLRILAIAVVAPAAVLLVNADKIDVKVPVAIGFVLVPLSYALLALQTTELSDFRTFALAVVISGAGFACLFSPIANAMVRSLPDDARAAGIAIFKMVLLLGGSSAATALTVVYDHSDAGYLSLLAGDATLRHFAQIGASGAAASVPALVAAQASILAYADNSKWVALASLVNLPLIVLLRKPGT